MAEHGLLNMDNDIDKTALFLVYSRRIQSRLDAFLLAWNRHGLRTEQNRSPHVIFHLSRSEGQRLGWWTDADYGDTIEDASDPLYGVDGVGPVPEILTAEEEIGEGIRVHDDERLKKAQILLPGIDFEREDGNRGMDVYQEVVTALYAVQADWDKTDDDSDSPSSSDDE